MAGVIILCQLLLALNKIHKKKIVNMGVKSKNILLDSEGNVKLAEFGREDPGVRGRYEDDNDVFPGKRCPRAL